MSDSRTIHKLRQSKRELRLKNEALKAIISRREEELAQASLREVALRITLREVMHQEGIYTWSDHTLKAVEEVLGE